MADAKNNGYFWNSDNADRVYDADSFSNWLKKFFTTGVFSGDLMVSPAGGMSLSVSPGYCNIEGKVRIFEGTSNLTLDPASASYPRIDSVVITCDYTKRSIDIGILKGSYSGSNPVPADLTRNISMYQIALAQVTVGAGATTITEANIKDTRMDSSLCGLVTGTVEEVDFSQFASQFNSYFNEFKTGKQADFETWFAGIQNVLDGDTAGNLYNLIQENKASIETNADGVSQNRDNIQSLQNTAQNHANAISGLGDRVEVNENAIETLSTIKSIAIPSSAWSGSVPYTNTVTVSGVKASDNWEIVGFTPTGDTNSDKAIKEALGFIAYGTTANNSITFRCLESKPTVNLPIVIRKVGI